MTRAEKTAPEAAIDIIARLRAAGHRALLAGGCVRDMLLGRTPKDYDVVTDAHPSRVSELFPRSRQVGAKFGVVLVRRFSHDVEVATFRSDGPYSDGRHPDQVTFGSPEEDAARRDFTINGLFYDPIDERVIDFVGGREDIERSCVRTIGDPNQRFAEDHLRMLRAVRFAAGLRFRLDARTHEAIAASAHHLHTISAERIWAELDRILAAPTRAEGWRLLADTGLHRFLVASWTPDEERSDRIQRRLAALPLTEIAGSLALAALWCDEPAPRAAGLARALRLSNRQVGELAFLVASLPRAQQPQSMELADLKVLMANASWSDLLSLLRADLAANRADDVVASELENRAATVPVESIAPEPLLDGNDLAALGMTPGPRFGEVVKALYRAQLNEQIVTREQALQMARSLLPPVA